MSKTKTKKILLSIGTISVIASSTIAFVVSCGGNENKKVAKKDEYQPKNISRDSFSKKGGLIGEEIAKNDYALLKDFVFSILSDKGEINKEVMGMLFGNKDKPNNPGLAKLAFPKKGDEGDLEYNKRLKQEKEKINNKLNKVNQKALVSAIKVLINKGASAKVEELKPIKEIIGQFASPAETAKISHIIDLVFGVFKSNGLSKYIKEEGGLFDFIIKIAGTIPASFATVINQIGFSSGTKTWSALLEQLKGGLKGLITDEDLKTILGLSDSARNGLLKTIFDETLLKSPEDFLSNNTSQIDGTIAKLQEVENDESKNKTKTFNILNSSFAKVKTLLDANKNTIKYKEENPQVPFLNGKGILGSSSSNEPTSLEDLTKNLIFLQTQIQKFLIYLSNVISWNKEEPILEVDQLTNGLTEEQKKKAEKITSKIKTVISDKQLWAFASVDLIKPAKFLHKLLNQKLDSIEFNSDTTTEFNDFIDYILNKIFEFGENYMNFSSGEAKALFGMINNGLRSVAKEKENAKAAFRMVIKKILIKLLGNGGTAAMFAVNLYIIPIIFGSQQTS